MSDYIAHYGTPRRSGRYPWGSGDNPYQSAESFIDRIAALRKSGLSEVEVAKALGMTTTELRARNSVAKTEKRQADAAYALRLKDRGVSTTEIGRRMGINESSVRALLDPTMKGRMDVLENTAKVLEDAVSEKKYVDVGVGNEAHLGISATKLNTAIAMLEDKGYSVVNIQVEQVGNPGHFTDVKVLAPPGETKRTVYQNRDQIQTIGAYTDDRGVSFTRIQPPNNVDLKRIDIRYGEDGGGKRDGLIEIRRGAEDLSLGNSKYAQVRIAVGGTHYIKGMAVYSDDLPPGVDIRFNTPKSNTGNKLDALKPQVGGEEVNPFKTFVRQKTYIGADGKEHLNALNIVNEQGDWDRWSRNLSSQMLSKQTPFLAKKQLSEALDLKRNDFESISELTNPVVKRKLAMALADSCDSASVHLKAAALPRQRTQVILPIDGMKENEVYAPRFRHGERVALVRFPHGGRFEIPEVVVNNNHKKAASIIGKDLNVDAIGLSHKVAARLSGADFDGDTVLVIPNSRGMVKSSNALKGLKDFNPQEQYSGYPGMKKMTNTQRQMGDISNLITDMTIKGASDDEIARAVRHSMVVIDAEKKGLNYKQSYVDNGISKLKTKYQKGPKSGADTLISKAKSVEYVPERTLRKARDGGPIDPATGKKVYVETGATYTDKNGKTVYKTTRSTKMAEAEDARTLSSGTAMEEIYANHANRLKALANDARKMAVSTPPMKYSPSAAKTYAKEVATLKSSLNVAFKNKPIERQVQLLADSRVSAQRRENPNMDKAELKKLKGMALGDARAALGSKPPFKISDREWKAIQAGAISNKMMEDIMTYANIDRVRELATPRKTLKMTPAAIARAKTMLNNGHDPSDVADALGVSVSTISEALK